MDSHTPLSPLLSCTCISPFRDMAQFGEDQSANKALNFQMKRHLVNLLAINGDASLPDPSRNKWHLPNYRCAAGQRHYDTMMQWPSPAKQQ